MERVISRLRKGTSGGNSSLTDFYERFKTCTNIKNMILMVRFSFFSASYKLIKLYSIVIIVKTKIEK